jgi:hypothetical protein
MANQPTPVAGATQAPPGRRGLTGRAILAGLLWLLACLAILLASVTVWAHQTLLTDQGWGRIVSGVVSDPEVVEATSERVVERVSTSLDVSGKISAILPGEMTLLSGAITRVVEQKVAEGLATAASTEQFQDAFVAVNERAHGAAMKVIRGPDSEALSTDEGTITIDLFPLIGGALTALQDTGIIPADVQIPDLSDYQPNPERVAQLETVLGRDLPDDIGTITLVQSDRLAAVQDAVRMFDVLTVLLIVIAILFVVLALVLSVRRLRMLAWLAIGSVVALLLGRLVTRIVIEDLTGALRTGESGVTVAGVIDSSVDSLMWFTFIVVIVALAVAALAILVERRAEISEVVSDTGGLRAWIRARSRAIAYVGIGLVAFVVLWNVGGPDITLVGAALVGIVLIAVAVIGGRDAGSGEAPAAGQA